jgi:hypothetical protein
MHCSRTFWKQRSKKRIQFPVVKSCGKYCQELIGAWLIITCYGLDVWIYWRLRCINSLSESINNNPQSIFSRTLLPWLPRTRSILVLFLRLTPPVSEWVILRPTVSRTVCLCVKHPSGAYDQIFITVRQLLVCWCLAPSLTRVRVCLLLCIMYNIYTFYVLSCVIHSIS